MNHYLRATFFLEECLWPTAPWADSWQNYKNQWCLMQIAYLIATIKQTGSKFHAKALNGRIPMFIIAEVFHMEDYLKDLPICPHCKLPVIDGFDNKLVHEN